jgi:hypothetical protein
MAMMTFARWFTAMNLRPDSGRLAKSAAIVTLGLLTFASGCTTVQQQGTGSSYLIVDDLNAASGAAPTQFGGLLQSDVQTKGGVFEDPGQVTLSLALKDPGSSDTPTSPTTANFITVTRYHVDFVRADGRNTQGVDVPFSFDGAMTVTVGNQSGTASFTLVRAQSKLEAPLLALVTNGSVISTIANITFYGTDQTGRAVSVTASIGVNFANWADPSS